ncbi:MAG TPA: bifunctional 4-hydroxy-2-oxoglutarate aldolase/2-dehydro-3-deoxy-phosphogluconate aldolase [Mobilitalea sp.]|nr:bifunctional 4-hydroxy-2-oxoglutarate aldolase/2-dehydro-3-deoxy-phosphogluconate aldolase [Mobilitalea sp.]
MNPILERIKQYGIIPVVILEDAKAARPLAKALCEGGLPVAEITFRTQAAAEAIHIMSSEFPQMLIGAGTVLNSAQVDAAAEAGAGFIVSPGLNPRTVRYCIDKGILIIPGCATPSDVEQAIENRLEAVKFFPAEQAGGLPMIKAMAAPYGNMQFMPTGGINEANIKDYLSFSRVLACGGSWMVKNELIARGDYETITRLTREAVTIVKEIQ